MQSLTMENALVRTRARVAERLASDLSRYRRGLGPTDEELLNAPLLVDWKEDVHTGLALRGLIAGSSAGPVLTNEVYLLDLEAGYLRTFSRLYRLGKPAGR